MAYENVTPGIYPARLVDWGCRVAEKINQPLIELKFEFADSNGVVQKMSFQSFIFKREGGLNQKTLNTLKTIGFSGGSPNDLNDTEKQVVDNSKEYQITIGMDKTGKYFQIDWVNNIGDEPAPTFDKVAAKAGVAAFDFAGFGEAMGVKPAEKAVAPKAATPPAKKPVKNFAPGADEPLPF